MNIGLCSDGSVINLDTGEIDERDILDIIGNEGGYIFCYGSYHYLGRLSKGIKEKWGKRARVILSEKGKHKTTFLNKVTTIYVRYLSIEPPREVIKGKYGQRNDGYTRKEQRRPKRIKWTIINMQEWGGSDPGGILEQARSLIELVEARGISLRSSMGATASAMVRKSSEWPSNRQAAAWFIGESARRYLPNGHYALRKDSWSWNKAIYIDQKSSHLSIASKQIIPAPEKLHRRGYALDPNTSEPARRGPWYQPSELSTVLRQYVGLYFATIECDLIPPERQHLYPWWALEPGKQNIAIWSPELLLLDEYVKLEWVSTGLLSNIPDWAMCEYSTWALEQQAHAKNKIIKPVLLAGVGMLGVNTHQSLDRLIVGGSTPPNAQDIKMPLFGEAYRSSIKLQWHPAIQNPVALGVIQAWCKTYSLLLARRLESEDIPAVQIVADAVIAGRHTLPSTAQDGSPFIPDGWKADTLLNWRTHGTPTQVLCDNHPKTPGIPRHRQADYLAARP